MPAAVLAALAALAAMGRPLPAQSVGQMLERDFRNAGKDVLGVWAAPFNGTAKDWGTFAAAMGLFGVAMLVDEPVSEWAIENANSAGFRAIKPLRRGGIMYTGKYIVPPVAAVYVAGLVMKNQDMRDFVMGCAASWVAQSPPRRYLAHLIGRARPDTTETPDMSPHDSQIWKLGWQDNWNMRSFPGGHIANAMQCATFWNKRFRLGVGEPLLYGVALAIGAGRMADRAHWLSDQIIGGILGYAIGNEVARRQLVRLQQGPAPALNVSPDVGGTMLRFSWSF